MEEYELLEAKKQLILRRRRLFSHYRQYEQWRRRQFSYDPCLYRTTPLPVGQAACNDYSSFSGTGAYRRRRQYRRQYSCAERSREDSRDSRESSSLHKYPRTMMASDTIQTDSSTLNQTVQTERISFDSSECGALAYQPLHYSSRHFHMLQEERSTSISERCTRSRINSAIFVSSEGRGFDSIEFLRRHGSQSVLCRKARSAENITDNGRKKSFSGKRQWRTDESAESTEGKDSTAIELRESRPPSETRTLSVLKSNAEQAATAIANSVIGHLATAAVTTSNVVVGSISIEAPPSHMKDELQTVTVQSASESKTPSPLMHAVLTSTSTNSASRDSTDTVEELILVPTEKKARVLVHQRSSNASATIRSQSPALGTPHTSPKALKLKVAKPPNISALPMVSVSGPSPTTEEPPLSECL